MINNIYFLKEGIHFFREGPGFCFYEPVEETVNLQITSFSIFLP